MADLLHVRLLGPPRIETSSGDEREVRGQKPWAVLARVLLADRPLTRREIASELFPDTVDPLGSLRWCLAAVRKALGAPDLLTGDPIRRDLPASITVDVHALATGACDLEAGELLEGVDPSCGPEFEMWLLVARQQVGARIDSLLRDGAITALSRGDGEGAVRLAERLVRRSPLDEGAHVLLVKSLVSAGHGGVALEHVERVEHTFRRELGVDPSPALRSAARAHVADPPPGVPAAVLAATMLESGSAALAAGAIDAGLDCLRRAGSIAERAGDDALLARCLLELGSALVHSVRGFDDEGSVLLEQAAQLARAAGDVEAAVKAHRERGYADALAGRRPEAQRHLNLGAELAGDDHGLLAGVEAIAAFNLCDWGRYAEGLETYRAAIESARRAGDRRREAWALGLGGWALLCAGHRSDAVEWVSRCLDAVHELGWVSFEPFPVAVLAEAELAAEDGTPRDLERCFAMSCQLEDPCWEGASGRVLALDHLRRGDHEGAVRWITDARRRCVRKSDTWSGLLGAILLTEAEVRAAAGDTAGAEAAARQLVAVAAKSSLDALLPRAVALIGAR